MRILRGKIRMFFKSLAVFILVLAWIFSGWPRIARADTTGEKLPTLGESVSENPWSDNGWNTSTNIYSDDGNTANVTAASYDNGDQTYVLKATGFNFSAIPDGSTIDGVIVRVNSWYRTGQGSGSMDLCQLLDTSKAKVGTNQCATPVALTTNNATVITKGGSTNTWGNSLTADWVKNSNFGVAIGIIATANNADVDVDYVTVEIYYTPPPNNPPSLTVSQPDGIGDAVVAGESYDITYDLSDAEDDATVDFYYDSNGSGLDGTAITGCQNQPEGTVATCSWDTTGITAGDYYVYGIATDGVNPNVNDYSDGVITINAAVVSISLEPGSGTVTYGIVATNQDTTASGVNQTQIVRNTGNVAEDFDIKGQNSTNWTLGASAGSATYKHEWCTSNCDSSPVWNALTTAYDSNYLVSNISPDNTQDFDLQITVPTSNAGTSQESVDVFIQATQH